MTRAKELELALLAMFLAEEDVSVSSYEMCTYPGGVFNDRIWRVADHGFPIYRRARLVLGLKPFRHRDKKTYGAADDRLAEFRAKERARLK